MNREIKFRFWDTKGMQTDFNGFNENLGMNEMFEYLIENKYIPMQFTGLKDKNCKDIYEGDILQSIPNSKLIVFYHEGTASFNVKYPNDDDYFRSIGNAETSTFLEIIGNIYQNPELIQHLNT